MWTKLLTPGLDNTRLFISLTAGAGTRCMSLLSSPPSLWALQQMNDRNPLPKREKRRYNSYNSTECPFQWNKREKNDAKGTTEIPGAKKLRITYCPTSVSLLIFIPCELLSICKLINKEKHKENERKIAARPTSHWHYIIIFFLCVSYFPFFCVLGFISRLFHSGFLFFVSQSCCL